MTVQKQRPIAPPHGSACGSPADVLRRTSFKDPSVFALRRFDLSPSSSGTPSDGYSFAPRLYPNLFVVGLLSQIPRGLSTCTAENVRGKRTFSSECKAFGRFALGNRKGFSGKRPSRSAPRPMRRGFHALSCKMTRFLCSGFWPWISNSGISFCCPFFLRPAGSAGASKNVRTKRK